jgi:hypothetical protein
MEAVTAAHPSLSWPGAAPFGGMLGTVTRAPRAPLPVYQRSVVRVEEDFWTRVRWDQSLLAVAERRPAAA